MLFLPFLQYGALNLGQALLQQKCLAACIMIPLKIMDGKTFTNHAGGIVGGLTNGNELVFRIAIKPTSSTPKEQQTLNIETGNIESFSVKGRHDLCIALRVPVVLEAVTAIVLTDLLMIDNKINPVSAVIILHSINCF